MTGQELLSVFLFLAVQVALRTLLLSRSLMARPTVSGTDEDLILSYYSETISLEIPGTGIN
jgi:hypothetical protein